MSTDKVYILQKDYQTFGTFIPAGTSSTQQTEKYFEELGVLPEFRTYGEDGFYYFKFKNQILPVTQKTINELPEWFQEVKPENKSNDSFQWQLKLAEVTGAILGCRKVLMDYEITQGKVKSIGQELGDIAEKLRLVVSEMKSPTPKPQADLCDLRRYKPDWTTEPRNAKPQAENKPDENVLLQSEWSKRVYPTPPQPHIEEQGVCKSDTGHCVNSNVCQGLNKCMYLDREQKSKPTEQKTEVSGFRFTDVIKERREYSFFVNSKITIDKFEAIKQAIEQILNNEA